MIYQIDLIDGESESPNAKLTDSAATGAHEPKL